MSDNRTTELREKLNAIRARFGASPTSMTDEQIKEMSEHYRPKLETDMVIIDEAKGDCTICKGWVDDGRGGTCVFTDDFWTPHCPYYEKDEPVKDYPMFGFC